MAIGSHYHRFDAFRVEVEMQAAGRDIETVGKMDIAGCVVDCEHTGFSVDWPADLCDSKRSYSHSH